MTFDALRRTVIQTPAVCVNAAERIAAGDSTMADEPTGREIGRSESSSADAACCNKR